MKICFAPGRVHQSQGSGDSKSHDKTYKKSQKKVRKPEFGKKMKSAIKSQNGFPEFLVEAKSMFWI